MTFNIDTKKTSSFYSLEIINFAIENKKPAALRHRFFALIYILIRNQMILLYRTKDSVPSGRLHHRCHYCMPNEYREKHSYCL